LDVTEKRNKIRLRKETADDGREIGIGSQASQSLRVERYGSGKRNLRLWGDSFTEEFITEVTIEREIRMAERNSRAV
jgi:hypothetical protein